MICVAISDKNVSHCLQVLDQVEMAEIRLDMTAYNLDEIKQVFSHSTPAIATCRPGKSGHMDQRIRLEAAIEAGAKYVDIELEAEAMQRETIMNIARRHQCRVIISYHNFDSTPSIKELFKIVKDCFDKGADIAKVATFSTSAVDNARLMSLYSIGKPLVAIAMGGAGKMTRIIAPLLGAEFTFAAMDDGLATAPGQIEYSRMKDILSSLSNAMQ